jgi:bifunctional enzyme CysN/CysC
VNEQQRHVVWHDERISRAERWQRFGLTGVTVWLTGLSGSGKSTIADALAELLLAAGRPYVLLDGDNLRHGLNADLGFAPADRDENVRRLGEVALLLADAGLVVLVAAVSPYRVARDAARARHAAVGVGFVEVHVDTPVDVCVSRDPKGLYAKALAGELPGMTGIDAPYEPPLSPELRLADPDLDVVSAAGAVLEVLDAVAPIRSS